MTIINDDEYKGAICVKYWQRNRPDKEIIDILERSDFEYRGKDTQTDTWFTTSKINIRTRKGKLENYATLFYTMHSVKEINQFERIFAEYEKSPEDILFQETRRTRAIYTKNTINWGAIIRLMPTSQIMGSNDSRLGEIEVVFDPGICEDGLNQIKSNLNNFLETLGIKENYRVPSYSYP